LPGTRLIVPRTISSRNFAEFSSAAMRFWPGVFRELEKLVEAHRRCGALPGSVHAPNVIPPICNGNRDILASTARGKSTLYEFAELAGAVEADGSIQSRRGSARLPRAAPVG
jgi:hypothetical protein